MALVRRAGDPLTAKKRSAWVPPDHGSDRGGLQRKVASGLKWTLLDTWGSQLLQLAVFFTLAGLLTPVDFGLVALAAVFVAFAQLLVDQGLGDALVQRRALTPSQIDTAFWTAVLTGSVLCVAMIALSIPISIALDEPDLAPILQVLSFVFVIVAFTSVQSSLARRQMSFRTLAIRRLIAIAGGGAVGIAAALNGLGAWSLVAQQLSAGVISVIALWAVSPWRPSFTFSRADFRELSSFGANIVGGDILQFLSRNTDNFLIGVFLGAGPLGLYALGYKLLETSQIVLVNSFGKVVYPTFARLAHDRERLRRAYTRLTRVVSAFTLPGYIGLALVAEQATRLLLPERWADSGSIAAILLLVGPSVTVFGYGGQVLNAVGRPDITLRLRLITAIVNVLGFLVAVLIFNNVYAVAIAYVLRSYLLAPLTLFWLRDYAGIPIRENLLRLRGVVPATLLMALAVLAVRTWLPVGGVAKLAIEIAVGIMVYAASLLILDRTLISELFDFARDMLPGRKRPRKPDDDTTDNVRGDAELTPEQAAYLEPMRTNPTLADEVDEI
ncbi:MAG TPA: lipopolysaccharide biosynthesis protein [Candidatus Limnocylindrales bacterium]|nr:lipopolysaccharide biosynthesis protein [Candidatus Limnocylindrales bacterium]